MNAPKLNLSDLAVTSFETAPAAAYDIPVSDPTSKTRCFHCPITIITDVNAGF